MPFISSAVSQDAKARARAGYGLSPLGVHPVNDQVFALHVAECACLELSSVPQGNVATSP